MHPINNNEDELLQDWLEDMTCNPYDFHEPNLDKTTTNFIRTACETLKQGPNVFVLVVETIEEYIRVKSERNQAISDQILVVSAAILLAGKYSGDQNGALKLNHISGFLLKITGRKYSYKSISLMEIEVFQTLDNKLPISTQFDNLTTLVEKISRECKLKVSVQNLCTQILVLVYVERSNWFFQLKAIYSQNEETRAVFCNLIKSPVYLAVGVLLTAFRLTYYKNFLDVDKILQEIMQFSSIHTDHFMLLCDKIYALFPGDEDIHFC